jgi:acyl-CoA synthetase (AMP-forming)/AMP-acid ligase II
MTAPSAPEVPFRPTVGEALRHAVAHWPDHDFVVTPARHMTYAQAEDESGRLARQMLAAGTGKGTRVGLYFPYGQEWVVAWLAASRIGALVMPLATTYRPAEIRKVLRIGDIDTLLTARVVLGRDMQDMLEASVPGLADAAGPHLFLPETPSLRAVWVTDEVDAPWATSLDFDAPAPDAVTDELLRAVEAEVVPADLAQVTYTSGSSADPKGVVHTHGTVVRATAGLALLQTADGTPPRFFCAFPFFWIGGTLILGAALQSGATVLVTERFDPAAALDLIERAQATHVLGWPTLLQAMRDDPSFAGRTLPEIAGLSVGPADVALVGGPVPGIPAHRGMSETVGNIASVGYRVVDPDTGLDVSDGDEGELWVRGYGLMHGYYKQERAEVFDADGWFHTGDRVFLHDGRAWFVGRTTEMVKPRGANVAPREVELFLEEEFDEVLYAFVLGLPHSEFGEQVAAVLVPARGQTLDPDDIARRAREQISSYKVPTRIDVWDEDDVPWLGSGKPDKRAIRERLEEADR